MHEQAVTMFIVYIIARQIRHQNRCSSILKYVTLKEYKLNLRTVRTRIKSQEFVTLFVHVYIFKKYKLYLLLFNELGELKVKGIEMKKTN